MRHELASRLGARGILLYPHAMMQLHFFACSRVFVPSKALALLAQEGRHMFYDFATADGYRLLDEQLTNKGVPLGVYIAFCSAACTKLFQTLPACLIYHWCTRLEVLCRQYWVEIDDYRSDRGLT